MIKDYLSTLPEAIRIEDFRSFMPYKICTGGSYLTYFTLIKIENKKMYKKVYGTTSPNSFNKATGKFRDKSIDDSKEESYSYLNYDEMKDLILSYINYKNPKEIKIFINDEEICY